jgi:hypothetical protein
VAGRFAPSLVVPRLAIVSYGAQSFWLGTLAFLGLPTTALGMGLPVDTADHPVLTVAPLLLVPLAATLTAAMLRVPARRSRPGVLEEPGATVPPGLNAVLAFAGVVMVAFWPATLSDAGRVGYVIRVLNYGLLYTSFLVGLYGRGLPLVFWSACLAVSSAISLTTGARFFAFVPLILFLAGRIVKTPPRRRARALALSGALMVGAIAVSGLVGLGRDRVGRSGFEDVTVNRGVEMAKGWLDVLGEAANVELLAEGVGRMVTWANPAVSILTPEVIPYRGLDTLWPELKASMSVSELSGTTREDALDLGLYQGPANLYGFYVNAATSVEFPLLADGWSRGGPWAALAFGLVAVSVGGAAEIFALRIRPRRPTAALTLFIIAAKLSMDIAALPLLASVRSLVLNGALMLVLSAVATRFAPSARPVRRLLPHAGPSPGRIDGYRR